MRIVWPIKDQTNINGVQDGIMAVYRMTLNKLV